MRPAIWTLLLLMTTACGQPLLVVKPNAYIRNLGISFSAGQGANEKIIAVMENHLDDFIERYNAAPKRKFKLFRAFPSDSCSIRITVFETKLVGAGQQVAGVFVSLVGISVPLLLTSAGTAMPVFFYYFPPVKSLTEVSLSPDISAMDPPVRGVLFESPGFLISSNGQVAKHGVYFERFLSGLVRSIEKQTA